MFVLNYLSGCANKPIITDTCAGWHPIHPDQGDLQNLSESMLRDVLKHNKYGEVFCGWKSDEFEGE